MYEPVTICWWYCRFTYLHCIYSLWQIKIFNKLKSKKYSQWISSILKENACCVLNRHVIITFRETQDLVLSIACFSPLYFVVGRYWIYSKNVCCCFNELIFSDEEWVHWLKKNLFQYQSSNIVICMDHVKLYQSKWLMCEAFILFF